MINSIKEWCKNWVGYYTIKNKLEEKNNILKTQISGLLDVNNELETKLDNITSKYELTKHELEKLLKNEKLDILSLKTWYEGRRNQTPWYYNGRRLGTQDVTVYLEVGNIEPFTELAKDLISRYKLTNKNTPTEIITMMYRYWNLDSSWTYVTDQKQFGSAEWWESPDRALDTRRGDCESKSKAMYWTGIEMLRLLDKEEHDWRLTFVAATITGAGGHAFLTWLYNDGEYYIIESTYDERNSKYKTWLKTPMRFNNFYGAPWGIATKYRSWRGSSAALKSFKDFN